MISLFNTEHFLNIGVDDFGLAQRCAAYANDIVCQSLKIKKSGTVNTVHGLATADFDCGEFMVRLTFRVQTALFGGVESTQWVVSKKKFQEILKDFE